MSLPGSLETHGGADADPPATSTDFARLVIRNADGVAVVKDVLRHTTLIGSRSGCNIQLVSPEVAPVHCALTWEPEGIIVRPLRSAFEVRVNGTPVHLAGLSHGDELQIGSFSCRLETNLAAAKFPARGREQVSSAAATPGGDNQSTPFARFVIRNRDGALVRKDLSHHTTLIGSLSGSNVQLVAPELSPVHCLVTRESGGLRIRDLRSRNGTRVNGRAMEICWLRNGDCVEVGPFVCRVETSISSPDSSGDDKRDHRFEVEGVVDRAAVERAELAREREELAAGAADLDVERQRIAALQAELQLHSIDLERSRAELEAERRKFADELRQIEQNRLQLDLARSELIADRSRYEEDSRKLEQFQADLERLHADLEREREQIAAERRKIEQQTNSLLAEKKWTDDAAGRYRAELEQLTRLEEKIRQTENELIRQQMELSSQKNQLGADLLAVQSQAQIFDDERATFADERARFDARVNAWESERERFHQESQRSSSKAEKLLEESAVLAKQRADLLAEKWELSNTAERLRAEQAECAAVRERLEADRKGLESEKALLEAEFAAIQHEREDFHRDQERSAQAAAALERERLKLSQDRTRLEAELRDLGELSAQREAGRDQGREEETRQAAARTELDGLRETLKRQEAALARATADVLQRNEDLLRRRQQLRSEQAFLRSGKRQFQAALHEFRAEEERFRRAVASTRMQRKSLRKQRRDLRAAGGDLATSMFPFRPEWVSPDRVRGLSDEGGMKPRLLDVGDTSVVFVVEESGSRSQVVLKVISSAFADAAGRPEIELRWRASLKLNHPHLVRTLRIDDGGEALCLAMEYVEGVTLKELIALHRCLGWREAAGYGFQAALGLDHLHEAGLIHGNIRPSHLLVEEDGTLKILTSAVSDGWTGSSVPPDQPGHDIPEAADYIAPEQTLDSSPVDRRADIYSLGCVLYHALTGIVPFAANTVHQKLEAHRTKVVQPLRRFAPDIPKDLLLAVKTMIAKQPEERYASAAQAAQALAPFARRIPAWIGCEPILASRIDRIRESLFAGVAHGLLEPDQGRDETFKR
jgi:pSer/pThr/pTyr-binding forkhead associated (FHA) protein